MDTLAAITTAIITAIQAGAISGLSDIAKKTIQDSYTSFKQFIQNKYHQASGSLTALEKKPDSTSKCQSLQEDLQELGAASDTELLQQAQALLKLVEEHIPQTQAIGIKLEDVKAANVRLQEIIVSGEQAAGVHIKKGEFTGDIEISKVKVDAEKK